MAFKLSEIIPWGRSFEEYRRLFALSDADLAGRILGCGDGPASFNAEATARGHAVVSCDPIYAFSAADIERRVEGSRTHLLVPVWGGRRRVGWGYFPPPHHPG